MLPRCNFLHGVNIVQEVSDNVIYCILISLHHTHLAALKCETFTYRYLGTAGTCSIQNATLVDLEWWV